MISATGRSGPARGRVGVLCLSLLVIIACVDGSDDRPLFTLLSPEQTGVTFVNTITTSDTLNVQTDVYVYNGAGVAVGDIDNDGLADLFFPGNMVSSRLYLNKGAMRFEDITSTAKVGTTAWATGATMVDINNDGHLDIYVSVSGREKSPGATRANLLFVNQGNRTFVEEAARYGIADTNFTTHAAFLDYDVDGCLDLFLLNNSPKDFSRGDDANHPTGMRGETAGSYNQLYRNDCRGAFTNVSQRAGILRDVGYGLGVVVSDLNVDGLPDIYVSNDAAPNDVIYVNNGNGTFTNRAAHWLKHASVAGMGVDAADFNNDGWPDVLQVDMMPRELARQKRMSGYLTYGRTLESRGRGFRDDFSVNSLQLSNGLTGNGDVVFSEIAHLAGVAETDWSWSALFADFDNDGHKDIFISNGYPKAVNDLDYQTAMFAMRRTNTGARPARASFEMLSALHGYEEPNYLFRNTGDLYFEDRSASWGFEQKGFSYGAAYADLNNDGRLDLVVSNIDSPAYIYENVGSKDSASNYLQIELQGDSSNRRGIGATVVLTAGGKKQYLYHSPYRGYMSTMHERLHFGLGTAARADSLEIVWPGGRRQLLTNVEVNRRLILKYSDATERPREAPRAGSANQVFQPANGRLGLAYQHQAATQIDYGVQPLLPYMVSRQGPPLAVSDVDGDSLDDLFVGGSATSPRKLFLQRANGSFVQSTVPQPWSADPDSSFEDWGALFFDANGDGRPDLYLASGGYQLAPSSSRLQDRLYINRGGGRFVRDAGALPEMFTSTAVVRAADYNGDGRLDLFVGGRLLPRAYPYPTRSYVLRNDPSPDGSGGARFTDVTAGVLPDLASPSGGGAGLITDALWVDFDSDRRVDLVTAGEWMPIKFYRNDGTRLLDVTPNTRLPEMRGWWYSLAAGDFDRDGRIDIVAGNHGLNSRYRTSKDRPLHVYAADFTGNQTTSIVLAQEFAGKQHTLSGMVPLGREIYTLSVRYPTYGSFADATLDRLFSPAQLERALHYRADTFASVFLHNRGGGTFTSAVLPSLAQISPVKGIVIHDVDGDGHLDLILAGNRYDAEPNSPREDAGNGLWLRGDGRSAFTPVPPHRSGFLTPRSAAALVLMNTPVGKLVVVANTGDSLQAFALTRH